MKLKYFYRINQQGNPVPASNVRRKSKPIKGRWKELKNLCCDPMDIPCICGNRYFVQIDSTGSPVDYTLIKRKNFPERDTSMRFMEVIPDVCCTLFPNISYSLIGESEGSLQILVNGVEKLNLVAPGIGTLGYPDGATIIVNLFNDENIVCASLILTGGYADNQITNSDVISSTFTASALTTYTVVGHLPTLPVIVDIDVVQPTTEDPGDGSITINATADSPYEIEYSIDGGDTWQDSEVFEDLNPGDYDIFIRLKDQFINCEVEYDANPVTLDPIV